MRTSRLGKIGCGLSLFSLACSALAQAYPSKPVRILIPYGPGTGIDVVIRVLNEALSKNLGQQFIAENRTGAAGTIAAAYVASQPADGYTLLSDSSSHTIVPSLMTLPFDTARDFAPVRQFTWLSVILTVRSNAPLTSIPRLFPWRRQPSPESPGGSRVSASRRWNS